MKHKYMAVVPKGKVLPSSVHVFESIAKRLKGVELLGSRNCADGSLQVGYSFEPSKLKEVDALLTMYKETFTIKDYGEDDGKRGRVTHADEVAKIEEDKPKKTKPKPKPKKEVPVEESTGGGGWSRWDKLHSADHERINELFGMESADPQSAAFGRYSVYRTNLAHAIRDKLAQKSKSYDAEKGNAFRRLSESTTYVEFEPFVKEAFGKNAPLVLKHMFHSK